MYSETKKVEKSEVAMCFNPYKACCIALLAHLIPPKLIVPPQFFWETYLLKSIASDV